MNYTQGLSLYSDDPTTRPTMTPSADLKDKDCLAFRPGRMGFLQPKWVTLANYSTQKKREDFLEVGEEKNVWFRRERATSTQVTPITVTWEGQKFYYL